MNAGRTDDEMPEVWEFHFLSLLFPDHPANPSRTWLLHNTTAQMVP